MDFQMPAVMRHGPQSQPKLQAILRMRLNGCFSTWIRSPTSSAIFVVYSRAGLKTISMGLGPTPM
jgi:hypothetical protein